MILRYAFNQLDGGCDAYFGHCGDKRARVVALSAGFVPLDSPVHIARWHKPLSDADKAAMTEEIFAIGLF